MYTGNAGYDMFMGSNYFMKWYARERDWYVMNVSIV